jgi:hypothetical protein
MKNEFVSNNLSLKSEPQNQDIEIRRYTDRNGCFVIDYLSGKSLNYGGPKYHISYIRNDFGK